MRRRGRPMCRPVSRWRPGGRTQRSAPTGSCFPFRLMLFPPRREVRVFRGESRGIKKRERGCLGLAVKWHDRCCRTAQMQKFQYGPITFCPSFPIIFLEYLIQRNRIFFLVSAQKLAIEILNGFFLLSYFLLVKQYGNMFVQ